MRDVFAAGKETHQGPSLLRHMIADGSAQRWIFLFKRIENRFRANTSVHIEFNLISDTSECTQVMGQDDANHD
jgi:hypothetical protein